MPSRVELLKRLAASPDVPDHRPDVLDRVREQARRKKRKAA
jgi:hypothetical protein